MTQSEAEAAFLLLVRALNLPGPEREYQFHESRRWRLDFYWFAYRLAVEIEGGVYSGGRHVRGKGFEGDCEKYNEAALMGIKVLRFTPRMIDNGIAADMLERAFRVW